MSHAPIPSESTNEQRDVQQRDILFSGRVQGVGFRYTTRDIARRYAVEGYVMNLADGRVRLVIEGPPTQIDAFLQEIRERLAPYIRDIAADTGPATGQFSQFEIRY